MLCFAEVLEAWTGANDGHICYRGVKARVWYSSHGVVAALFQGGTGGMNGGMAWTQAWVCYSRIDHYLVICSDSAGVCVVVGCYSSHDVTNVMFRGGDGGVDWCK